MVRKYSRLTVLLEVMEETLSDILLLKPSARA